MSQRLAIYGRDCLDFVIIFGFCIIQTPVLDLILKVVDVIVMQVRM